MEVGKCGRWESCLNQDFGDSRIFRIIRSWESECFCWGVSPSYRSNGQAQDRFPLQDGFCSVAIAGFYNDA